MNASIFEKAAVLVTDIEAMSSDERYRISQVNVESSFKEHQEFKDAFVAGQCYICERPLTSFSKKRPCLHWFLRPKGFKKNDVPAIAEEYGFFEIQTYLRWVANTTDFAKHINDLPEESSGSKLIELTIRYKNLEWSFSCGESDYLGHQKSQHFKHPHYHFQMRSEQKPFVKFNDFHLPFTENDILSIETKRRLPNIVMQKFPGGEGMSEILNEKMFETLVANGRSAGSETDADLQLDTMIIADEGTTISGEDLYNIFQEAKSKGVTVASLMHKRPISNASTNILITPGSTVVEQSQRNSR